MKLMISLAALLLVSACSTTSHTAPPAPDAPASECLAGGGSMKQVGKLQSWKCITPYKDAGKACTDSSQCEGECRTSVTTSSENRPVTGACQADNGRFGCSATVEKGQLGRAMCVD
ncbi:hypothetical protein LRQ11_21110 [Pseudomonas sp. MAFF 311095]|jgi:hypothetical protein|uniref:Lipoprotein n=1 Tax=Pseudomonas petroselini TaxID=2899822 RepID=A0ABS8QWI5_9PSED|nr:hypothetical protein [Pseudomonas petroselini]MCD7039544.1 hypothetical protein [Pseudomonas petroselini]MCD7047329.1 hypothetical protein [Pseudomonas petroselini]MCD7069399.1 hypothetical protein [Pseudomonas petroselini]MCD7081184.1 hypothetical protein [Pseudomonas petroselini]